MAFSQEAAFKVLKNRPTFPKSAAGTSLTRKLRVRNISEQEFDTTLITEEGELVTRRIINFQATDEAKLDLPEVAEAMAEKDWIKVLNLTELTGSVLSTSSKFNKLSDNCEVEATFTVVEGKTKDGVDYNGMVKNCKINSIVAVEELKVDNKFTMLLEKANA